MDSPPSFATPHISSLIKKRASVLRPSHPHPHQSSIDSLPLHLSLDGLAGLAAATASPTAPAPAFRHPKDLPVVPLRSPRRAAGAPGRSIPAPGSPGPGSPAESFASLYSPNEPYTIARVVRQTPGQERGPRYREQSTASTASGHSRFGDPLTAHAHATVRQDHSEADEPTSDEDYGLPSGNVQPGQIARRDSVFGGPRLRRFGADPWTDDSLLPPSESEAEEAPAMYTQNNSSSVSLARAGAALAGKLMVGLGRRAAPAPGEGGTPVMLPSASGMSLASSMTATTLTASSTSSSGAGLGTPGRDTGAGRPGAEGREREASSASQTDSGRATPGRPPRARGRVPVPPVTASMYDASASASAFARVGQEGAAHQHQLPVPALGPARNLPGHKVSYASLRSRQSSGAQAHHIGYEDDGKFGRLGMSGSGTAGGMALISLDQARQRQASRSTSGSTSLNAEGGKPRGAMGGLGVSVSTSSSVRSMSGSSIAPNLVPAPGPGPGPEQRVKSRKSGLLKLFAKADKDRDKAPPLPLPQPQLMALPRSREMSIGEPVLLSSTKSLPALVPAKPKTNVAEPPRPILHRGPMTASPAQMKRVVDGPGVGAEEDLSMSISVSVESMTPQAPPSSRAPVYEYLEQPTDSPGEDDSASFSPADRRHHLRAAPPLPLPHLELRPVSMVFSRALPADYLVVTPSPPRSMPRRRSPTAPGALSPLGQASVEAGGEELGRARLGRETRAEEAEWARRRRRVEELREAMAGLQREMGQILGGAGEGRCDVCGCRCGGDGYKNGASDEREAGTGTGTSVLDRGRMTGGVAASLSHNP